MGGDAGIPLTPALLRLDPMFRSASEGSALPKTLRRKEAVNARNFFTELKRPSKCLQVRGFFCALRGNITPL
jgi:hypothetical protein